MKLSKKTKTGGYLVLSKKADDVIIKDIDLDQHIIICDLTKGVGEDKEYLARDRYFFYDNNGQKPKNIPFVDLSLTDINTILDVE